MFRGDNPVSGAVVERHHDVETMVKNRKDCAESGAGVVQFVFGMDGAQKFCHDGEVVDFAGDPVDVHGQTLLALGVLRQVAIEWVDDIL